MKRKDLRGFLMMRKGIFQHLKCSNMDEQMFTAYSVILDHCDWSTGEWWGCAAALRAEVGMQWSERTAERILERLVDGRYITSHFQRGKYGNYKIEVNNFVPTEGPNMGVKLRPVAAGRNPLSADKSADTVDGAIVESADKSSVMAVGTSVKVPTKVPTKVTTKVTTQVASNQYMAQNALPTGALQDFDKKGYTLSVERVSEPETKKFFDVEDI